MVMRDWLAGRTCGRRRLRQFGRLSAIVLLATSTACAVSDEGAVDYRKAELTSTEQRKIAVEDAIESPPSNGLVLPVQLVRKDIVQQDSEIDVDQKVSIRLRDGLIHDCSELFLKRNPIRKFDKNCEIAIVFKAFELDKENDFDFSPGSANDGRLVYYSGDVAPGQFLNLHNMPVYGPINYEGKPLGIDIHVIEVDAEDEQIKALLSSLASVGAKAYPPAQPVLAILDNLGEALLQGGTDDIEFRYSMVLDPSGGYKGLAYATAEAGNYVFVREQTRTVDTPWENYLLDENTGRLHHKNDNSLVRDKSYLTVQILRNAGGESVILDQNLYGPFREALDKDQSERIAAMKKSLNPTLEALALDRLNERNFSKARTWLEVIRGSIQNRANRTTETNGQVDPAVIATAAKLHGLIQRSVNEIVGESADGQPSCEAIAAATDEDDPTESDLSPRQVDILLEKLGVLAEVRQEAGFTLFSCSSEGGFANMSLDVFLTQVLGS